MGWRWVGVMALLMVVPAHGADRPDRLVRSTDAVGEDPRFPGISMEPDQCGTPPMSQIERRHAEITEALQRSSRWLDRFFGDDRDIESLANSVVRLSLDGNYVEAEAGETKLKLRGKVNLPRIQQRLQLVFEGEPENDDITGLDKSGGTASLRYKVKETLLRETSLSLGFRGGLSDPRLFLQLRTSRSMKRKRSLARVTPAIGYDFSEGWEANVRFDLEHRFTHRDYLRFTERPGWKEKDPGLVLQQSLTYFHRFTMRNFMAVDWLTTVPTEPAFIIDVTRFRLRYRRDIWKHKLFFEVAPGIRFADSNDYVMQWELGMRLEVVFEP